MREKDIRIHITDIETRLLDIPYGAFAHTDPDTGKQFLYVKVRDEASPFGYSCYSLADGKQTDFGSQSPYLTDRNRVPASAAELLRGDGEPYNGFLTQEEEFYRQPLEFLGLETRLRNVLRRGGCGTVGDVGEMVKEGRLGTINNIGEKSEEQITAKFLELAGKQTDRSPA